MWKREKSEMTKVKDSVKREIVVNAPLEKVWDALTKEKHLNRWYTKEASIDFKVGGKGYMNHGWALHQKGFIPKLNLWNVLFYKGPMEILERLQN